MKKRAAFQRCAVDVAAQLLGMRKSIAIFTNAARHNRHKLKESWHGRQAVGVSRLARVRPRQNSLQNKAFPVVEMGDSNPRPLTCEVVLAQSHVVSRHSRGLFRKAFIADHSVTPSQVISPFGYKMATPAAVC